MPTIAGEPVPSGRDGRSSAAGSPRRHEQGLLGGQIVAIAVGAGLHGATGGPEALCTGRCLQASACGANVRRHAATSEGIASDDPAQIKQCGWLRIRAGDHAREASARQAIGAITSFFGTG